MHVTAILRILSILDVLPLLVSRWQGKKKAGLASTDALRPAASEVGLHSLERGVSWDSL